MDKRGEDRSCFEVLESQDLWRRRYSRLYHFRRPGALRFSAFSVLQVRHEEDMVSGLPYVARRNGFLWHP